MIENTFVTFSLSGAMGSLTTASLFLIVGLALCSLLEAADGPAQGSSSKPAPQTGTDGKGPADPKKTGTAKPRTVGNFAMFFLVVVEFYSTFC